MLLAYQNYNHICHHCTLVIIIISSSIIIIDAVSINAAILFQSSLSQSEPLECIICTFVILLP